MNDQIRNQDELYILWTNADPVTAEKMVFMYARNALKNGWWKSVTVIVWGAPAKLVADNDGIRGLIQAMVRAGVKFQACKACADQLGATPALEQAGVEVIYYGQPLTQILKEGKTLLTV
jgi:hypothetical protein